MTILKDLCRDGAILISSVTLVTGFISVLTMASEYTKAVLGH